MPDESRADQPKSSPNWLSIITTVGPYPTRPDADRANIAVRATLSSGAYVINLKSWCPGHSSRNGYIECGTN